MEQLLEIKKNLNTQDNRITDNPMFCVQEKRTRYGLDPSWVDEHVWLDPADYTTEVSADFPDAIKTGYAESWHTVMVAFTQAGCEEYLRQDGHNLTEPRIYVESFNRCPEMIAIREYLINLAEEESTTESTKEVPVSQPPIEWYASDNGETFSSGPYPTKEDAVAACVDDHQLEPGGTVWVGKKGCFTPAIFGVNISESISVQALEACGDVADGWPQLARVDEDRLGHALTKTLLAFLTVEAELPQFFPIVDVEQGVVLEAGA